MQKDGNNIMVDKITKETRSKIMKAIKSKNTKIEEKTAKELWKRGIRFRRNVNNLFGKPDIAIKKYKIVIFIDSCFWHYCPDHGHFPKSNNGYWDAKIKRNIERDKTVVDFYNSNGWNVLRIWEHSLKDDFSGTLEFIIDFINQSK